MAATDSQPGEPSGAFTRLVVANQRRIYAYLIASVSDPHEADDLLQETLTALWRKFAEYDTERDFAAWAVGVARYEVLDYWRNRARAKARLSVESIEMIADEFAAHTERDSDMVDALHQCLGDLPETHRDLIRLRYAGQQGVSEIAERVGCSLATCYRRLNEVHRWLMSCIDRHTTNEGVA